MSFFDVERKFGFVHVSKTSSIIEWKWREHCGVVTEHGESRLMKKNLWIGGAHDSARYMRDLRPDLWSQCFTVGFVRNPWAWWRSAYHWYNPPRHTGFDFEARFPTFRKFILRWEEWRWQFPWDGYRGFLCDHNDAILVDYVGRSERLQEDFDLICERTGFPRMSLPCKPNRVDYRKEYDDEMKWIVAEFLAKRDLEIFPYEFEDGGDC